MSISASLSSFRWDDRKINLRRHPRRAQLRRRRARRAARVRGRRVRGERRDGRRGHHRPALAARRRARALAAHLREHARPRARRLLPQRSTRSSRRSARTWWPPRSRSASEHELEGVIDLVDMKAYRYDGAGRGAARGDRDPRGAAGAGPGVPREADGRGRRGLRRADGALPRGRGDLARGDRDRAQDGRHRGHASSRSPAGRPRATSAPTACSTRFVEDLPSPAKKGPVEHRRHRRSSPTRTKDMVAFVFKTLADPFAGRLNLFRVYQGVLGARLAGAQLPRAREGADRPAARAPGQGLRARRRVRPGRHRRGGEAEGDPRRRRARPRRTPRSRSCMPEMPKPVMAFAIEAKAKGDEEKMGTALRRLQEEDPTIDFHRDHADRRADRGRAHPDPRRGDRRPDEGALRRRGGAAPAARALPRDDQGQREGARPLQEADRRPRPVRRLPHRDRAARPRARASSS